MLKFLFIGILLFLLYRMVVGPKVLNQPPPQDSLPKDDGDFVDYEEVD